MFEKIENKISDLIEKESRKIYEATFSYKAAEVLDYQEFIDIINTIPLRDNITISLSTENDELFIFDRTTRKETYRDFIQEVFDDESITVRLEIQKNICQNRFSIYCFEKFVEDILQCSIEEILKAFTLLFKESGGYIIFDLFDNKNVFCTKTMFFASPEHSLTVNEFERNYRLQMCRENSYFYNQDIYELLENAIYENPPVTIKEGYLIKEGYNAELDELKAIRSGGKEFIASFESHLKEETEIKNLKVGYNKVFGYYIEITKGQIANVPEDLHWERRQTLTNAERYISPELKEKEALILNAEEKIIDIEYQLFCNIKDTIKKQILALKDTANILAELDAITSLAVVAEEYRLVKPELNHEHLIEIKNGRHPVIEKVSNMDYVSNDCIMDSSINTLLITGPNMSGKSTYMRQLAIIIIMAQMGSFVPATSAKLPIIDKIFTRIGASDDLVSGESTFMVEMKEAKNAIMNATEDSLILFDELGRGTATYDGMSLAEAILNYVAKHIRCKTLFSTHYHELTSLERQIPSIKNVHVSAKEIDGKLIFLHKVQSGAVDKSYGIHVAKLAGLPEEIIKNAEEILSVYEKKPKKEREKEIQLVMEFPEEKTDPVYEKLKSIDPLRMTPIDALTLLYELKETAEHKVK